VTNQKNEDLMTDKASISPAEVSLALNLLHLNSSLFTALLNWQVLTAAVVLNPKKSKVRGFAARES